MRVTRSLLFLLLLADFGGTLLGQPQVGEANSLDAEPLSKQQAQGVWQSRGYGWILQLDNRVEPGLRCYSQAKSR